MYIAIIVIFSKYINFKLASISVFLTDLYSLDKKQNPLRFKIKFSHSIKNKPV